MVKFDRYSPGAPIQNSEEPFFCLPTSWYGLSWHQDRLICLCAKHVSAHVIQKGHQSFDTFSARLRFLIQRHQPISAVTLGQAVPATGALSNGRMHHLPVFKISIICIIIYFYSHFRLLLFYYSQKKQKAYIPLKIETQYFFLICIFLLPVGRL